MFRAFDNLSSLVAKRLSEISEATVILYWHKVIKHAFEFLCLKKI